MDPSALPWPKGLTKARLLMLDGTEKALEVGERAGSLVVRIDPATEVAAVRFEAG